MESPWGTTSEDTAYNGARQGIAVDDLTARQPQHQAAGGSRSSLGLFIERSTSAPPSSSAACPVIGKPSHTNADSLVGSVSEKGNPLFFFYRIHLTKSFCSP